jgi:hypothetical protein
MRNLLTIATVSTALVMTAGLASAQPATKPVGNVPAAGAAILRPPGDFPLLIPRGNHYVCYPAKAARIEPIKAVFHDQFGDEAVTVVGITRVCAPANKRTATGSAEVVDRNLHYTCYQIRDPRGVAKRVLTRDQFVEQKVDLSAATEVCLPAGKRLR